MVQRASTTAIQALRRRRTTGSATGQSDQTPLQADRWWSDLGAEGGKDPDQAAALASAAISGPEHRGGVRLPTICGEAELATSVGVR